MTSSNSEERRLRKALRNAQKAILTLQMHNLRLRREFEGATTEALRLGEQLKRLKAEMVEWQNYYRQAEHRGDCVVDIL